MTAQSRESAVTTPAGSRTTRRAGLAIAYAAITVIVGGVTLGTDGDPSSVLAALCLVPLLTGPYVHPRHARRAAA